MEFTKYSEKLEAVRVLSKCLSTDPVRQVLHYISAEEHGEGTRLVATDGRRLCWVDFPRWDNHGLYRIIANRKTLVEMIKIDDELTYPNWKQVVPQGLEFSFPTRGPLAVALNCAALGIFIDPAMVPIDDDMYVTVHTKDPMAPIMIEHEDFGMVVMPMRPAAVFSEKVEYKLRQDIQKRVEEVIESRKQEAA